MRKPFCFGFASFECHSYHIEHALQASVGCCVAAFKILAGRSYDACLLGPVHIFLWRSLYVQSAGLYLYKMYSISPERYDVYFQVSTAPVPFEDGVAHALEQCACDVLSLSA